jgi:3',5'-cyclic AMP phosphodiesterase CpdA
MIQLLHISDLHLFTPGTLGFLLSRFQATLKRLGHVPYVGEAYSFAYQPAQDELPAALRQVAEDLPTVLVLTGDICSLPYEHPLHHYIDPILYEYVATLFRTRDVPFVFLPILGNHDLDHNGYSNFRGTRFDIHHNILSYPRTFVHRVAGIDIVFFVINTAATILPATGKIDPNTLTYLSTRFTAGLNGRLKRLSAEQYRRAIKILLLHHYPLPRNAYGQRLSRLDDFSLRLKNARDLLDKCRNKIDIFLFGHSHLPVRDVVMGSIMIDAGSTLASNGSSPRNAQFQSLRILNADAISVLGFVWDDSIATYRAIDPRRLCQRDSNGHWS